MISRYLVSASVNVQPAGSRLNGFHVYFCTLFPYESKELIQAKLAFKIQKKFVHLLEIKGLSVHTKLYPKTAVNDSKNLLPKFNALQKGAHHFSVLLRWIDISVAELRGLLMRTETVCP